MDVRARVREYVCVSFNQVEIALHIYCHSLFHTPFNNLYSIYNCLLCQNQKNVSLLITKYDMLNIRSYEHVHCYERQQLVHRME